MVVSKLSIIQNTTVVDGKTVPIIELEIKPGYYSSISNLSFTYEIIEYTSRIIKIQIKFENPILISSLDDPDKLNVKFNANKHTPGRITAWTGPRPGPASLLRPCCAQHWPPPRGPVSIHMGQWSWPQGSVGHTRVTHQYLHKVG